MRLSSWTMDKTPTHAEERRRPKNSPRTIALWLFTRRSGWRGAVARVAILAVVLVVFRYHVVTWLVAGHNGLWKLFTRSDRNNPADVSRLARLRGPGARMLVRIGEARALAQVVDSGMIPALLDLAREHSDAEVRAAALMGTCNFHDEDILEALARSLDDPGPQVRRAAIAGFHDIGDGRHIGLLVTAREKETDPRLRTLIERAISRLSPAPERPAGGKVRVAAIQFASEFGKPEKNRERLAEFVRQAAREGAKIVALPETAITGYMDWELRTAWQVERREVTEGLRGRSPAAAAEPVPGPSTRKFASLARELGIYLTVPIVEVERSELDEPGDEGRRYFNTVVLVGPDGKIALHYRKLNPWPFAERGWATAGDRGLVHVDTPYGRLALLVCYDINYEPLNLRDLGVDTLLYPIAWVDRPKSPWFGSGLPRLARDADINIIGANWTVPRRPSWHGYGQSLIVSRSGRLLAQARSDTAEEIVYAEIDVPAARPEAELRE